jgi:hypothetical protein
MRPGTAVQLRRAPAYSSLALHYLQNLEGMLQVVYRALAPAGWLVFSAEHPMTTAPAAPGWMTATDGHQTWPVDNYLSEGPR